MSGGNVQDLIDAIRGVDKLKLSLAERLELIKAAQGLIVEVERPWDTIMRVGWSGPSILSTLRVLVDLKLFEKWVGAGGDVKTPAELSELVDCDPALLERLVRNLATHKLLTNPGPHQYGMNDFSRSLADPDNSAGIPFACETNVPAFAELPSQLARGGYKNTLGVSPKYTAFTSYKNYDGTLFDWFTEHPDVNEDFGRSMKGYSGMMTSWVDQYPTEKLVSENDTSDSVVVVDLGGSTGHDLNAFQRKHKLSPGRLVLQDLPDVVGKAKVENGIKIMPHDFFTTQPIKGAKVYYLHSILHDWPDKEAVAILQNIKPALVKGVSKILIHDNVFWPQDNKTTATASDVLMLGLLNAGERTIEMWKGIAEQVGLEVTGVFTSPTSAHSIVELELV